MPHVKTFATLHSGAPVIMIDRRRLLGLGTAAALGPGLSTLAPPMAHAASSGIRRYVKLGRTGLEVSEIGFGSASSHDPDLVRGGDGRGPARCP
jgi:hypothetical protein